MQHTDKLRFLTIENTNLDDDILASVSRFMNLEELSIKGCKVTEDSIPLLKTLSERIDRIALKNDDVPNHYLFFHRKEIDPELRAQVDEILSNPLIEKIMSWRENDESNPPTAPK
jgi:hypothetical protein